jgi:hypothetical protein
MSAKGRREDLLAVGQKVALREAVAGYEPGTLGVVTRFGGETVYVRVEPTNHVLPVRRDLLEVPAQARRRD